jgi:putative transposase
MPYFYRQMSPEKREEVVQERLARGYPLHSPPHPFRGPGRYLITAANFEHQYFMDAPARRTDFEAHLLEKLHEQAALVFAWVVLANHYHVLLQVPHLDKVSNALKWLHGTTANEWNQADGQAGRQVWYRFNDRKIRNDQHFYRALNYVHYNPVKHGYVTSVYDWPWSSVHNYLDDRGREWLRTAWQKYRPERMGLGWDD